MELELLQQGGPVVIVLLALSVLGLTVVLFKIFHYRHYSVASIRRVEKAMDRWVAGERQVAREALARSSSPYAKTVCSGFEWLSAGNIEEDAVREELNRRGHQVVSKINSLNGFIEQISYLSPMLGLLGTVLGMIDVFHGLASHNGGADSGALASGIWEALLTTAVGLSIAIPFALMHFALESRATTVRRSMEDQLTRLFTARLYTGA